MLGAEHVRDSLLHLKNDRKVQTNTILVNRSALLFLYVNTLKQTWFDDSSTDAQTSTWLDWPAKRRRDYLHP